MDVVLPHFTGVPVPPELRKSSAKENVDGQDVKFERYEGGGIEGNRGLDRSGAGEYPASVAHFGPQMRTCQRSPRCRRPKPTNANTSVHAPSAAVDTAPRTQMAPRALSTADRCSFSSTHRTRHDTQVSNTARYLAPRT